MAERITTGDIINAAGRKPMEICSFRLAQNNCTAEDTVYAAEITEKGAVLRLLMSSRRWQGLERIDIDREMQKIEGIDVKEALERLLGECKVMEWDGFEGACPPGILDGSSMSFEAKLLDGRLLCASGDNNFPPNYRLFKQGLYELLNGRNE